MRTIKYMIITQLFVLFGCSVLLEASAKNQGKETAIVSTVKKVTQANSQIARKGECYIASCKKGASLNKKNCTCVKDKVHFKTVQLKYYDSCAYTHPVARSFKCGQTPTPANISTCRSLGIKSGDTCSEKGTRCYIQNPCRGNWQPAPTVLVCAEETPGRCFTKSSREYKEDIRYLTEKDHARLNRDILNLKLAHYRYKSEKTNENYRHLGFIIEDNPDVWFVSEDKKAVDLYAYISAMVSTMQKQEKRIKKLEQKLDSFQTSP